MVKAVKPIANTFTFVWVNLLRNKKRFELKILVNGF